MKYMIMLYGSQRDYDAMSGKGDPPPGVSPEDFVPMYEFMEAWNKRLVESGEYVDAHGLSAPVHTRRIQLRDGVQVVTDGPYPETEEVLAGYNIVECASFDRATEIAAELSKCPYPEGAGGEFVVDIRPIAEGVDELVE
jgi:hypothetical protein